MGFDRPARRALSAASPLLLAASALTACAHTDPRRFPLAPPVVRDQDLDLVEAACHADPDDPKKVTCAPEAYESSFSWDAADNSIFLPVSRFFAVTSGGEATNVNAFDEVPDSSWFVNRIGASPLEPEEAARGFCPAGPELVTEPPDGAWLIDHGKDNGANPGFRVKVNGTKFMLKTDDEQVERTTAATAIASRIYYAAGWWAPCDSVVYFKRSALRLKPGLMIKANVGPPKPLDEAALTKILSKTGRRGDLYRASASRWLPGHILGPFTYVGKRDDDPSDVIPHEDRRDLRGARLIAAWLNHFDSREQNTMSTWMPVHPEDPHSPGYVRHWYIDLGDCFGSEWSVDAISKRHGFTYLFDPGHIVRDFVTLGIPERPWDVAHRTPGEELFGYFSARNFDPATWRGEYPNPTFGRMTEHDGAWAARIIARFTPAHVAAMVRVGDFTNEAHTQFLTNVLVERRQILLQRYFSQLSPVTDVHVEKRSICAVDLARRERTYASDAFHYAATVSRGGRTPVPLDVSMQDGGRLCVSLDPEPALGGADDAAERYVVVQITNGASRGPLALHLYDLGEPRGLQLVGIERL
jgi:hypothetical protein